MTEPARDARGRIVNPQYTSEELGLRLLRLFDSTYHADELTPERVFETTGVRMERPPQSSVVTSSAYGHMSDGGLYSFVLSTQPSTGNKLTVEMESSGDRNAPLTSICGFDLEQYKRHLEQTGFKGSFVERGRWHYHRGLLSVWIYAKWDPSEQIDRECVYMVIADSPVESARSRRRRNAD